MHSYPHGHGHSHGHSHSDHFNTHNRAFAVAVILNLAFVAIEAVYGVLAGQKGDLNILGAFLHMAADTAVSLGIVVAGLVIILTGISWIDPLVSLVIAAVIFFGTWQLLKDSVTLAVDAVPRDIDPREVYEKLNRLPGVRSVHHLHIWALSTTENALTVHLVKPDASDDDRLIEQATQMLAHDFNIRHVTIQWERAESNCPNVAYC
ncbi:cation diffusion facilitator family transporter [Marinobacter sp. M216]|uniref:Cation diffusion facilitator family transporter n=1 Tax=Marinobacter albus TaxID=3030833 RepID=A0ABT7H8P5_9GAMM|nr:cation diffusion facilitator family transporter [Marinobacter sp. M216]MDK9556724.1 cation diffusion facilitator family transporter [Marinobacter sp. M216]